MKNKSLIINEALRVNLREADADGKGNYGSLALSIQEKGPYGDYIAETKISKADLKKLIDFLQKAVRVLI